MTKTIGAPFKATLAAEAMSVVVCWKITRTDGEIFRFTSGDAEITVNAETYSPTTGNLDSAMAQSRGLGVDNVNALVAFSDDSITEADLRGGLYDGAIVEAFTVNTENTTEAMSLFSGWTVGNVEILDHGFRVDLIGIAERLQNSIVECYSVGCRANLGDSHCGVDVDNSIYTLNGSVSSVTSARRVFVDSSRTETKDVFTGGTLTWASGAANDGLAMEVKRYETDMKRFTLFEPMPYDIEVGDDYEVTYGCDKSLSTCAGRFDNAINFRGEPWIPNLDTIPITRHRGKDPNVTHFTA